MAFGLNMGTAASAGAGFSSHLDRKQKRRESEQRLMGARDIQRTADADRQAAQLIAEAMASPDPVNNLRGLSLPQGTSSTLQMRIPEFIQQHEKMKQDEAAIHDQNGLKPDPNSPGQFIPKELQDFNLMERAGYDFKVAQTEAARRKYTMPTDFNLLSVTDRIKMEKEARAAFTESHRVLNRLGEPAGWSEGFEDVELREAYFNQTYFPSYVHRIFEGPYKEQPAPPGHAQPGQTGLSPSTGSPGWQPSPGLPSYESLGTGTMQPAPGGMPPTPGPVPQGGGTSLQNAMGAQPPTPQGTAIDTLGTAGDIIGGAGGGGGPRTPSQSGAGAGAPTDSTGATTPGFADFVSDAQADPQGTARKIVNMARASGKDPEKLLEMLANLFNIDMGLTKTVLDEIQMIVHGRTGPRGTPS